MDFHHVKIVPEYSKIILSGRDTVGIYLPVAEAANTSLYVESFGYEPDSRIARWGPGQRNYSILHYVTAGTGYFNGNPVRAGQGFCIRKNQLQEYHSSNDEPWTYFWVIFNGTDTDQVFSLLQPDEHGIFRWQFQEELDELVQRIFRNKGTLSFNRGLGYFYLLLSCHEQEYAAQIVESARDHVVKAKRFIDLNYMNHITIEDAARSIPIKSRYLYRLFRKAEGVSPKAYLTQVRLNRACELLLGSTLSVTQIAASVGFDSVLDFSRFFSSNMKISPSQYRKNETHIR